jgi:hypothetical protein
MAKIALNQSFAKVAAGNTSDNYVEFADEVVINDKEQQAYLIVSTGAVQFSVGKPVDGTSPVLTAGAIDRMSLTISNKRRNLYFKQSTGSDEFFIGI